jgi:hypothetical protein
LDFVLGVIPLYLLLNCLTVIDINGTNPNAAKPAPDQSLLLTASYTSYAATASPTGVKLAASSVS